MAILTKDAILKGINDVQKYEIQSLGGEIYLRPLSQGEWDELAQIESKAMGFFETNESSQRRGKRPSASTMTSSGKIDLAKTTSARQESMRLALAMSLNNSKNNDEWTEEDVKNLKSDAFNEIYNKIREISGIEDDLEESIDDFPKNR